MTTIVCTPAIALAIVGCDGLDSGNEEIPKDDAQAMLNTLDELQTATAGDECSEDAEAMASQLVSQAEQANVDGSLGDGLTALAERAQTLVAQQCVETGPSGPAAQGDTTEPTEPDTTEEPATDTSEEPATETTEETDDGGGDDEGGTEEQPAAPTEPPETTEPGGGNPPPGPAGNPDDSGTGGTGTDTGGIEPERKKGQKK